MNGLTHRRLVVGLAASLCVAGVGATQSTSSYLYDLETIGVEVGAGEWVVIPAVCEAALKHPQASTIEGTAGDDTLTPLKKNGVYAQAIFGLAGDDDLSGGNQHDCLVGGTGNDVLGASSEDDGGAGKENGKDVLLGGPGNDHLVSGNGKDYLDGGEGYDVCEGENGKDVIVNCEEIIEPEKGRQRLATTTVPQLSAQQTELGTGTGPGTTAEAETGPAADDEAALEPGTGPDGGTGTAPDPGTDPPREQPADDTGESQEPTAPTPAPADPPAPEPASGGTGDAADAGKTGTTGETHEGDAPTDDTAEPREASGRPADEDPAPGG